jgi:hypothetical protein
VLVYCTVKLWLGGGIQLKSSAHSRPLSKILMSAQDGKAAE